MNEHELSSVLLVNEGWREAMTGTITLYNKTGERLHTIYLGAAPEYGKANFLERLEREVYRIKLQYSNATYVGIADGARVNWDFLERHTQCQVLDFFHATEYLAAASHASTQSIPHCGKFGSIVPVTD